MEYHSDRFEDYSLLVYKKEKLVALLPANKEGNTVYSHQGLTYGGLILPYALSAINVFSIFDAIVSFLKVNHIEEIHIKQIPEIYCKSATNEIAYVLGQSANLYRRDMVLAIDYAKPLNIHKTKLKHYKKAENLNLTIKEETKFDSFWSQVLEPRLLTKHNAKPVHSINEIQLLYSRFPDKIKQFNIYYEDRILAGLTVFETATVVKSQYGATTKEGERFRALDYLFLHLIKEYKLVGKKFFSMGTVVEDNELKFNQGLLKQKEELGCDIYTQDFFRLKL
ncbi:hypothetical protein GCM10022395_19420 [Snuella lapsa]|uniref:FemAB family protein n=2 Tax=Snuella lapsa TaxID=870481 RepID=A0ABP6XTQ0_9FLAO